MDPGETPSAPATDHVGRRLGDFVLLRKIGAGSFGTIFVAEQVGLGRQAVVKILRPELARDERLQRRFLLEARLASTLDHPYAAHIYSSGVEPDGVLWIAMELVRGTSLEERLREGPMALSDAIPFLERLCEVVHTAHELGIVHRDIKPQNVMLIARAGALLPKLLDLGIAKYANLAAANTLAPPARVWPEISLVSSAEVSSGERIVTKFSHFLETAGAQAETSFPETSALTGDGEILGSPAYMAPELWESESVDWRCDLYALGVLAYEVLAGRRPFSGSIHELAEHHALSSVPALPTGFPSQLGAVIAMAMSKDAADRPVSALELGRMLRENAGLPPADLHGVSLGRDVVEAALQHYPQPIAEAVAEIEAARSAYQSLDAVAQLTRVIIRFLTIIALAEWARLGRAPLPKTSLVLVGHLLERRLEDDEWLALLKDVVAHKPSSAEWVLPELAAFVDPSPQGGTLDRLVHLHAIRTLAPVATDSASALEMATLFACMTETLRDLRFLESCSLVVTGNDGRASMWDGVRRKCRVTVDLTRDEVYENGTAVIRGTEHSLCLSPLVFVSPPSNGAPPELFLVEGRGRLGLALVALPSRLTRTSEATENWLRGIASVAENGSARLAAGKAPYCGLAPLNAEDADVFFGREKEVETFLNRLRTEALLTVVGASGAGKSSFVRAGVIPDLDSQHYAALLRPGARPLAALRAKLLTFGVDREALERVTDSADVAALVHQTALRRSQTLVVVVDQLEELFTQTEDAAERNLFCSWLAHIAGSPSDPARVILTLRDDFLARTQELSPIRHRIAAGIELLSTPGYDELHRILVEPARRAGFAFTSIELVDEMIRSVEGRSGALPLLSFAAAKMWEERDEASRTLPYAAYRAMGGVTGALSKHAETTLAHMSSQQQGLVRAAFRVLVTAAGTRASALRTDLITVLGGGRDAEAVLERLIAARLLVIAEDEQGDDRVEIIHEELISAWPRLALWQRDDLQGRRFLDDLRSVAPLWRKSGKRRGLLWRDEILDDFLRWFKQQDIALGSSEDDFVRASLAERTRSRRFRSMAFLGLVVGIASSTYLAWRQTVEKRNADAATTRATLASTLSEQSEARARAAAAGARDAARVTAAQLQMSDPTAQLALLRELEGPPPPGWNELAMLALNAGVAHVFEGHTEPVKDVAFSPDGERFASGSEDGTVRVWRTDGRGAPVTLLGHTSRVNGVAFSPDGARVASGSFDGTVRIWTLATMSGPRILEPDGNERGVVPARGVAFSPDGLSLATAWYDGVMRVFSLDGAHPTLQLTGHTASVHYVAFSPDGQRVASSSLDGTIRVSELSGQRRTTVFDGDGSIMHFAFSPDGGRVAGTTVGGDILVWDAVTGRRALVLKGHTEQTLAVAYSPDGSFIASAGYDRTIRVWQASGLGAVTVLNGHRAAVSSLAFSADGKLASASFDGTLRLWSSPSKISAPIVLRGHKHPLFAIAVSPDGDRVVSIGEESLMWRTDGSGLPMALPDGRESAWGASFSADGRFLASSDEESPTKTHVRVWDAAGNKPSRVFAGHPKRIEAVALSPDGRNVASGSDDGTIRVQPISKPAPECLLNASSLVSSLAYSPDGRWIASGSLDKTVSLWNSQCTGERRVLSGPARLVTAVSFDGSAALVAASSEDGAIYVWNVATGALVTTLRGHTSTTTSVALSPDGLTVASGSEDKTIRLWTVDGSRAPIVLRGHEDSVTDVEFTPDGKRLVSCSIDKTVRIWRSLTPVTPDDPRLWSSTNVCPSIEDRMLLLGLDKPHASTSYEACLRKVLH